MCLGTVPAGPVQDPCAFPVPSWPPACLPHERELRVRLASLPRPDRLGPQATRSPTSNVTAEGSILAALKSTAQMSLTNDDDSKTTTTPSRLIPIYPDGTDITWHENDATILATLSSIGKWTSRA